MTVHQFTSNEDGLIAPDAALIAETAIAFGRFESAYISDLEAAQGQPAINALFAAYAVAGEVVKSGDMSPELSRVIHAMSDAFLKTQKVE